MKKERIENAIANKKRGYNCAQAVVCAFRDRYNVSEELLLKVSEGFGGGMGCGDICGAVAAMGILAGLESADGNAQAPKSGMKSKSLAAKCKMEFEEKNKSSNCRELKGIDTKIMLRSCMGCVEDAVEIFSRNIGEK